MTRTIFFKKPLVRTIKTKVPFNASTSWSELLLTHSSSSGAKVVTAMKYAIEILQNSARGIGLPERQYVWFGGNGVDADGDGHIGGNSATPAIVEGAGENEIPWCFEFGDKQWKAGKKFKKIKEKASPVDPAGNIKESSEYVSCE